MSRFLILCKHESESDRNKMWLLELRCAISKANNIARASAMKIDDLFVCFCVVFNGTSAQKANSAKNR